LCGHKEVVKLLLDAGALCERDTFQGERCLYNALTMDIRKLLLQYDYSKAADPLQPLASHITSLLSREEPRTYDITLSGGDRWLNLHKFILSARSPYFAKKLQAAPETTTWKISNVMPPRALELAMSFLYLGPVSLDPTVGEDGSIVLGGVDKLSKLLEVSTLSELVLETDRRKIRQARQDEIARCRDQIEKWFEENVLARKLVVEPGKGDRGWIPSKEIFADVILQADEEEEEDDPENVDAPKKPRHRVLFPVHRAMLVRSEVFEAMFTLPFRESELYNAETGELQVVPLDIPPDVVEVILRFLYTEDANVPLHLALEVLYAADQFFIETLKNKAALVIITSVSNKQGATDEPEIDIYDVIRAAWFTKVRRLEEFGAQYIAHRLEDYLDKSEFSDLIVESAARIQNRQETDSIELIDDIRWYLDQRYRLRFEELGLDEVMDEDEEEAAAVALVERAEELQIRDSEAPLSSPEAIANGDDNIKSFTDMGDFELLSTRLENLLMKLGLDV
jgi:ankyrin repeat/BTB/POZ domain-containing protein 1